MSISSTARRSPAAWARPALPRPSRRSPTRFSRRRASGCDGCPSPATWPREPDMQRLTKVAGGLVLTGVLAIGAFGAWRLYDRDPETHVADAVATPERVARGEYLVKAAD